MVAAEVRTQSSSPTRFGARVGIVTYDFFPSYGGQGRHTFDLWRHLRDLDVDVRVLSPKTNNLPGHSKGGAILSGAVKSIGFSLYAGLALRRWLSANEVDLIHLNGGPGGVLLLSRPNCRTVFTAHHTYAQQARMVRGQRWKRALTALEARGYNLADAVTAVSPSTARSVCDELGVNPARIRVVPDGFDPETFRPLDVHSIDDAVLFVGRLDERKGFELLLRSWAIVARAKPCARLFVIGSGPLRRDGERFLDQRGIRDSVAFLERQPDQELAAWYNRVSVVAVPSRFEGFGLSALEAMACATPVVATATEGLRDVVIDGVDGRLVPPGDPEAFAAGLLAGMVNPRRLSRERLQQIYDDYAWPNVTPRFVDVYREVLRS